MAIGSVPVTRLWPHQVEAVDAITNVIGRGGRTSLLMACGTGKTRIGGVAAAELGARRRALVVVPTLELLVQTLESYRAVGDGPLGQVVAVCSDPTIAELELLEGEPDVVVTTNAGELANVVQGRSRVTVLSTYASLPVIAAAHAHHELRKWDLAVVDEAHRTTGKADGPWKVVHHDAQIPAKRRLYMTATPRISAGTTDEAVVSMDNPRIYGEVAYRLPFSRAIDMGLLADYRVVVPVVTDTEVHRLAADEGLAMRLGSASIAPSTLAGQIAVLRTMTEYGVRRAISYHHRVADAALWARTLPATAGLIPGAIDLWAGHVSGAQPPQLRRRILERLADVGDETVVISNARVLNEGIDVPVVDAVVFSKPRESAIDTIQALGRALRTGGRKDKIATIVVPLLLAEGESPEAALESSEWEPVWKVLRALRDHDDRLDEALRVQRTRLGEGRLLNGSREVRLPPWLQVHGVDIPDEFARAITIRAVRSTTPSWDEYYGAAREYRRVQGNADIPTDWITTGGLRLGDWWRRQKVAYNAGDLSEERTTLLEELGIVWDQLAEQWLRTYEEIRQFVEDGGDLLDIPEDLVTRSGVVVVNWCGAQRTRRRQDKVSPERIALLDAIGFPWEPTDARWMRRYHELKTIYEQRGSILRLPRTFRESIWLEGQKASYRRGVLTDEQVRLLREIGLDLAEDQVRVVWMNTYEELKAFHAEQGHWTIPDDLKTLDGVRLRSWTGAQRTARRNGRLAAEYVALLDRIGFPWNPKQDKGAALWNARYEELRAFAATHGHLNVPHGTPLYSWLYQQRKKRRLGKLPDELAACLAEIEPLWYDDRACLSSDRVREFFRLTDESWARIEPLLPIGDGRSRAWRIADRRAVIEGIIWKLRADARWDDLPEAYGPSQTVYAWWRQWHTEGLWAQIEQHIQVRGEVAGAKSTAAV